MNLHSEIMSLHTEPSKHGFRFSHETAYLCGFRDARHAAAELSLKQQAKFEEALNRMNELDDDEAHADIYWEIKDLTDTVLKRIQEL